MRCRPGDLAMYVGRHSALLGRVVEVCAPREWHEPAWFISPPLHFPDGKDPHSCLDRSLRPIRPNQGEDEILRIAGKPQTEPA